MLRAQAGFQLKMWLKRFDVPAALIWRVGSWEASHSGGNLLDGLSPTPALLLCSIQKYL